MHFRLLLLCTYHNNECKYDKDCKNIFLKRLYILENCTLAKPQCVRHVFVHRPWTESSQYFVHNLGVKLIVLLQKC